MSIKEKLDKMTVKQLQKLANKYIVEKFSSPFFSGFAFADYLLKRKDYLRKNKI